MELCLYNFWPVLGCTSIDPKFAFWLVELVGEALVSDMEFSSVVDFLVYWKGTESADF